MQLQPSIPSLPSQDTIELLILVLGLRAVSPAQLPAFKIPENHAGESLFLISQGFLRDAAFDATNHAAKLISTPDSKGLLDLSFIDRTCGWFMLPFALTTDVVKLPICLALASISGVAGGLIPGSGALLNQRDARAADALFDSLLIRVPKAATVLCIARCETPISVRRSFEAGRKNHFLTVAVLHAAFESRDETKGRIRLASGYSISESECPSWGRRLFNLVEQLKGIFIGAAWADVEEEATFIAYWLPILWEALLSNGDHDAAARYPLALMTVVDQLTDIEKIIVALPVVQRRADELNDVVLRIPLFLPLQAADLGPPPYD